MHKNIFDAASDQPKKKKSSKNAFSFYDEISNMMSQINKMKEDLDQKIATLYSTGEAKHIDVGKVFGDNHLLSNQDLKLVKEHEREITKKIDAITPPETCLRAAPKSKDQLYKERMSKTRGARKKWLPMR